MGTVRLGLPIYGKCMCYRLLVLTLDRGFKLRMVSISILKVGAIARALFVLSVSRFNIADVSRCRS